MYLTNVRTYYILRLLILMAAALSISSGCVYFNTFYNARKAFNEAESARKESLSKGRETVQRNKYDVAVEKSLKVIEEYPNSSWYDDALFVLGVSYYYTNQELKSERRLRELLANYPDSKFADDATIYLAKAKLKQGDEAAATGLFEEIFKGEFKEDYKTEAALALGNYYQEKEEYDKSRPYLMAVRDSLGNDMEKRRAQKYIADGLFEQYDFKEAFGAYLQLLGMSPDKDETYHATYRAAVCSFRLQSIEAGMDYLNKLIADEIYFDSSGVVKIRLAEGYELDGDLVQAENYYSEVVDQSKNNIHVAEANYRLGLIYQFDYDNLTRAKEFYDKASGANRSTFAGQDSFQRSTDIGKLAEFMQRVDLDTGATQSTIDDAAAKQYELAELYWFNLNKPDSAINEMRYLIDNFPTAYDSPKAMMALSSMIRNFEGDSVKADSILNQALINYPNSDYMPEIVKELNLKGTPSDSGYPEYYFRKAEDYLVDREMRDSAKYFYQIVVDSFPDSKYYIQARFALIWVTENYESPGDSSVYFAYQEFADSFPGTEWGLLAKQKLATEAPKRQTPRKKDEPADTTKDVADDDKQQTDNEKTASTSGYTEQLQSIYIGESGDTLPLFPSNPVQTRELFVYPTEAYYLEWEGDLYFQIKLDFSGEVLEYRLMTHSGSPELDNRAEITLKSMRFDQLDVSAKVAELELQPAAEGGGYWFVYKYRVILPDHLR